MPHIWQSPFWPQFTYDPAAVELALADAQEALGEAQGLQAGLSGDDLENLRLGQIVQEALSSFGIEGVTLNAAEIEASVIASLRHRERAVLSRRSDAIVALMLAAREATGPLTEEDLFEWHRLLFYGMEVEDKGGWRRFDIEIVRSAAAGKQEVLYAAPPPDRVADEMRGFLDWLAQPRPLPVPIAAAIAHLWFESIHPFSDGNGRIGRAIIEHVFATGRALPFSLSRQIEREKKAYYQALQAGRREGEGAVDATAFVLWFLRCLQKGAEASREEARYLLRRNAFFLRYGPALSPRQRHALEVVFAQGPKRVAAGLSARSYRKITGVSAATATRDLTALERQGALVRSEAGGRAVTYAMNL
ncbi:MULTISPECIES: Fic family protein [unclassified Haematobacter]|uniref:Fic family protein n=1 Tax=unclassified Haematobacter TaxID=2640585 RepID=UPI0025BFFE7C|nr:MULTISPECIES: Fic family protein [unclassified Haematobacter]